MSWESLNWDTFVELRRAELIILIMGRQPFRFGNVFISFSHIRLSEALVMFKDRIFSSDSMSALRFFLLNCVEYHVQTGQPDFGFPPLGFPLFSSCNFFQWILWPGHDPLRRKRQ